MVGSVNEKKVGRRNQKQKAGFFFRGNPEKGGVKKNFITYLV